jgi:galactose-1-phosphate uridylyltransferase
METTISINKLNALPNHLKKEVNDFIEFLLEKEKKKLAAEKPIDIMKFSGVWSDEEADEISQIIKEGCDNIDEDGWK